MVTKLLDYIRLRENFHFTSESEKIQTGRRKGGLLLMGTCMHVCGQLDRACTMTTLLDYIGHRLKSLC